jgi:hypothetical protein
VGPVGDSNPRYGSWPAGGLAGRQHCGHPGTGDPGWRRRRCRMTQDQAVGERAGWRPFLSRRSLPATARSGRRGWTSIEANRTLCDAWKRINIGSRVVRRGGFATGPGDVRGKSLLHLQASFRLPFPFWTRRHPRLGPHTWSPREGKIGPLWKTLPASCACSSRASAATTSYSATSTRACRPRPSGSGRR